MNKMEGVKVTLLPSQETDEQSFSFEELGVSYLEWSKLSGERKMILVLDNIVENICSDVDYMSEY